MEIKDVMPLCSRIIVEKDNADRTVSGIIIPESAKQGTMNSLKGTIVAVGSDVTMVEVSDQVLFGQYSGTKFKLGEKDNKYIIMNEDDLLCKIKEQ